MSIDVLILNTAVVDFRRNDFLFTESLRPKIVYYMYSGLSEKADANGGKDLAEFMKWVREKGMVTIADSPLSDRYGNIKSYVKMLKVVHDNMA